MSVVQKHYDEHLGPVYAWMLGGAESAIESGAAELERLGIRDSDGGLAIDLGAGFGTHAIPQSGFDVQRSSGASGMVCLVARRL